MVMIRPVPTHEPPLAEKVHVGRVGTGLIITINRGYYFPATTTSQPPGVNCTPQSATGATAVVATCVSIQYAYSWRFGRAASLLGGSAVLPASISATAVAMNED